MNNENEANEQPFPDQKTFGTIQSPRGMHDILPEDQPYWECIRDVVRKEAAAYNFERIDTPILEATPLFTKGVGQGTDIVEKEMYSFKTKGGDALTMRPEGTASVVRAYLEHGMPNRPSPIKLYYIGPFFRHESPQKGRFRQFHQIGFEILNSASPASDAEIIQLTYGLLSKLKIKNITIQISSLGDNESRVPYLEKLRAYLREHAASLPADCKKKLRTRPLAIFDCKEEKALRVAQNAPKIIDNLSKASYTHFKQVLEMLDELELPYNVNPLLVRGLDYYTRTVFEIWKSNDEDGEARNIALGGGGRYDNLIQMLGGPVATPAGGVALGIERLVEMMKSEGVELKNTQKPTVFLAQLGFDAKKRSLKLFDELRKQGIIAVASFDRDSLKSQLKQADRYGVLYRLMLGQKELLDGRIILRDMATGSQEILKLANITKEIKDRLKKH